jgi:threonine dehydrogenase-like Zn-dependent dehydrogenase
MANSVLAAVVARPGELRLQEMPLPRVDYEGGLLRVELTGVCGTDVRDFPRAELPRRIMGHEIVGTVEQLGAAARRRWGLADGDRILLEEYLPCGVCPACRSGDYRLCPQTDILLGTDALRYGATGLDVEPGLWGGYSQYVYLHPQTVFHRVPAGLDPALVPLALPMSNGYEWAYRVGHVAPAEAVVIIGPGQQGLSCLLAAKIAGAGPVVVAGLAKDAHRLRLAGQLGADRVVDVEAESLTDVVAGLTDGRMASLAIDTAAASEATLELAIGALGQGGRLVVGARNDAPVSVPIGQIRGKTLTVTGVRGHTYDSVEWGLRALREHEGMVRKLTSGVFGLDALDEALAATRNGTAIHVSVNPWV